MKRNMNSEKMYILSKVLNWAESLALYDEV